MFKNYLKIAFRILIRNKMFSLINIIGMSLGITCCIFILFYIQNELSYDKYHKDLDRIYRVAFESETQSGKETSAETCGPTAQVLKNNYPQIEKLCRILTLSSRIVRYEDKTFNEKLVMFADNELFDVFTIPYIKGNPATALTRPKTIVISERISKKYFGEAESLGKTIKINQDDYEVTCVVKDHPQNTHLKYDLILSMKSIEGLYPFDKWFFCNLFTYIKLRPGIDANSFSNSISNIADIYAVKAGEEITEKITYFLQPVRDIHLYSHLRGENEPPGNPLYLSVFGIIGILVLFIACANFINLTTARATKRAKEVGVRKVIGAFRGQLLLQFLTESVIIFIFSMILSIISAEILKPVFNQLTGMKFSLNIFLKSVNLLIFFGLFLLINIVSGFFPALTLSTFKPILMIKGVLSSGSRGNFLRKLLVIGQYSISISLIVGTIVIYKQTGFMKDSYLGFDKDQKIILPLKAEKNFIERYNMIKDEFSKVTGITGVTMSSKAPGQRLDRWTTTLLNSNVNNSKDMNYLYIDEDFLPIYNIKLIAGKAFMKELRTDDSAFIINETASKSFGFRYASESVGKHIESIRKGEIIGVIGDFNYYGLQTDIEPLVINMRPNLFRTLTLQSNSKNYHEVISQIESKWHMLFPNVPFEFSFLDENLNKLYKAEDSLLNLLGIFTILGVLIACLGLFGLTLFSIERRTKEIGIRKVLGSSIVGIVSLLSNETFRLIIIANVIAYPISYYLMNEWLNNFAYKIKIEIWIFIITFLVSLLITFFTLIFQSVKAATANPVDSLRYE